MHGGWHAWNGLLALVKQGHQGLGKLPVDNQLVHQPGADNPCEGPGASAFRIAHRHNDHARLTIALGAYSHVFKVLALQAGKDLIERCYPGQVGTCALGRWNQHAADITVNDA